MKYLKRAVFITSVFLLAGSLVAFNLALRPVTKATGGSYQPSDLLGFPSYNIGGRYAQGLNDPESNMVIDTVHHRMFIPDNSNNRVLVFELDNSNHLKYHVPSFVLGQPDFVTNDPNLTQNGMDYPYGVAYDLSHDRLYVSDESNQRVLVYDLSGGISNGMNASFVIGEPDFTTSGQNLTQDGLGFTEIISYDTNHNRLFVTDYPHDRVMVYDGNNVSNGMNASFVIGEPDFTTDSCDTSQVGLCEPFAVTYDNANNRLFVGDSDNNRVMVYDGNNLSDGMPAQNVLGQPDFSGNSPNLTQDGMSDSYDLAYDPVHNYLFDADDHNNRVLVYDLSGGISDGMPASHVLGQPDFTTGAQNTTQDGLSAPEGLGYDPGNSFLYVADDINNRVLVYDLSGGINDGMNASDVIGQPDFTSSDTNNDSAQDFGGYIEGGTALDTVHHRLFAAACGNWVNVYNLDSSNNITNHSPSQIIGSKTDNSASQNTFGNCVEGLAYDSARNILFVDDGANNRIMVFDLSGGITSGMNASFVIGQPDFTSNGCNQGDNPFNDNGSGVLGPNDFCEPFGGITFDSSSQYLYLGDSRNARVLVFDTANISDNMNASFVIGQPDFVTKTENVTQDGLGEPYGILVDPASHRLFVDDWSSPPGRVMVYDTSNLQTGMNASFVLGESDFTSSDSVSDTGDPTPDDKSFSPAGLAYDPVHQRLFVEDDNYNRVLVFDASQLSNGQSAMGVIGQPDLTTSPYPNDAGPSCYQYWNGSGSYRPTSSNICDPEGISDAYDTVNNRLYVSDSTNTRVLVFNFAHIITGSVAGGTVGSSYSQAISESGSQGTVSYSVNSGSLPAGVVLSASTGVLSGTPTTAGNYNFTVGLADNNGAIGTYTDSHSYSLSVASAGGGGGGSNGGGGGSSSSGSGHKSSSSSGDSTPASGNTIDLDTFSDFTNNTAPSNGDSSGAGHSLSVSKDDVLEFALAGADGVTVEHKITVGAISGDSISLTFEPTSITLNLNSGQATQVDVNNDGVNDIGIKVLAISGSTANLQIWKIDQSTAATTVPQTTGSVLSSDTAPIKHNRAMYYIAGISMLALLGLILVGYKQTAKRVQFQQ